MEIDARELISARFPGKPNERSRGSRVLLATGEVLRGEIVRVNEEQLSLRGPLLGDVSLRLPTLRALVLDPEQTEDTLRDALQSNDAGQADRLVLRNGDVLRGSLTAIEGEKVTFRVGQDDRALNRDVTALVLLDPSLVDYSTPKEFHAVAQLSDGSSLIITQMRSQQEKIELQWLVGQTLSLSERDLVDLSFRGGRVAYLSDLEPIQSITQPFSDRRFAYRKDRSVSGGPLVLKDQRFTKGLGTSSRSALVFDATGYSRFQAVVGLDASAGEEGSVRFLVRRGQETVFDSGEMTSATPPKEIDLALNGAKTLELIVDFERRGDVQDIADWANARFIR